MCKKRAGAGPRFQRVAALRVSRTLFRAKSSRLDGGFVYQQGWDIVPHRIHAMAVAAFQAFPIIVHHQRLFAGGASQDVEDVEDVLGNHAEIVRQKRIRLSSAQPIVDRLPDCRSSSGSSRITGGGPVEEPKATCPARRLVSQNALTASQDDNLCHS